MARIDDRLRTVPERDGIPQVICGRRRPLFGDAIEGPVRNGDRGSTAEKNWVERLVRNEFATIVVKRDEAAVWRRVGIKQGLVGAVATGHELTP